MEKQKLYADYLQHINKDIPYLIYKVSNALSLDLRTMVTGTYLYYKTLPKVLVTSVPACIGLAAKLNDVSLDYRRVINICKYFPVYIREYTCVEMDIQEETLNLELTMCIDYKFDFKEKSYDLILVCQEIEQKIEDHIRKIEELKKHESKNIMRNAIEKDDIEQCRNKTRYIYHQDETNIIEQNRNKSNETIHFEDSNQSRESNSNHYKEFVYGYGEHKRRAVAGIKHTNSDEICNNTLKIMHKNSNIMLDNRKTNNKNIANNNNADDRINLCNDSSVCDKNNVLSKSTENALIRNNVYKNRSANIENRCIEEVPKQYNDSTKSEYCGTFVDKKIIRLPSHIKKIENRKECVCILFRDICLLPISLFYSWKKIYKACVYIEHMINEEFVDENDKDVVFIAEQIINLYEDEYFHTKTEIAE